MTASTLTISPRTRGEVTAVPALGEHEVHVWTCDLVHDVTPLVALLSEDELARARRFRFDVHRRRFIAGRGTLRRFLAAYVRRDAALLRFAYGPLGKPRLVGSEASFNVSHCDDRMMFAIRRTGEVGIDVERLRPVTDADAISASFFHSDDAEQIRSLQEPARSELFLRHWTRHEARGKFLGRGVVEHPDFHQITTLDLPTQDAHLAAVAFEHGSEGLLCQEFRL
jgi:4'-phosphopantetheinyl transferase